MSVLIIILSACLFAYIPEKNEFSGNLLSVDAPKTELQVSDRLPLSDYAASSLESQNIDSGILDEIVFSVASLSNDTVSFEIYLEDNVVENGINSDYIKILLTDTSGKNYNVNNGIVPVFSSLSGSVRFPGYRKVYSGRLESGHINQYIIKMWVSDEYLVKSDGKIFKTSLIVRSI